MHSQIYFNRNQSQSAHRLHTGVWLRGGAIFRGFQVIHAKPRRKAVPPRNTRQTYAKMRRTQEVWQTFPQANPGTP
jgi:hypothetical protein